MMPPLQSAPALLRERAALLRGYAADVEEDATRYRVLAADAEARIDQALAEADKLDAAADRLEALDG